MNEVKLLCEIGINQIILTKYLRCYRRLKQEEEKKDTASSVGWKPKADDKQSQGEEREGVCD